MKAANQPRRATGPAQAVLQRHSRARLQDIIDRCLDKGIVVQSSTSVRLFDVDVLLLEADSVVTSLQRYLDYAAAMVQTARAAQMDVVEEQEQVPPLQRPPQQASPQS